MYRMTRTILVSLLLLLGVGCSTPTTRQAADYVFTNGKIYTVNDKQPWAEAVAVKGNKIVYVGDNAGAAAFVGKDTKQTDLAGRMMMPGFVEGHFHVTVGAIVLQGVDLQTDDLGVLKSRLRKYAKENPDKKVILGYGVRPNTWDFNKLPTAKILDEIVPDRPVYLWLVDGHAALVNSKAYEVAGITRDTPSPAPGFSEFTKDKQGNLSGYLLEVPAQMVVYGKLARIDSKLVDAGLRKWAPKISAAGITTVHDYGILGIPVEEGFELLTEVEKEGKLPYRVYGSYYWNNPKIDPVPIAEAYRKNMSSELVHFISLKVNMDGDDAKYNGLYVGGYTDKPDVKAKPIIPYKMLNDVMQRADAAHLNVTCHCFGDLAVRKFLDAVEYAEKVNPKWDRRPVVSHGQLVHPDDYSRFAKLNVTYDTSGQWMALDPVISTVSVERLGKERVDRALPMKAVADAGGNVSLGSDWAAATYFADYKPLNAITIATTRQFLDRPDMPLLGGETARVPLALAIQANTRNAAYSLHADDQIGSIEVGKKADLIVLEKNLFDIDPHDIHKTKVEMTMMNGVIRHQDGL